MGLGFVSCDRKSNRIPIILLTAQDTSTDNKVMDGADDYIVKPFDLQELLAQIRALLRREFNIAACLSGETYALTLVPVK